MFLYNGKYGVARDDNGLYYMRARYYNISIKRFINQDVMLGHKDATGSLNRYAYCEGNPVSYIDPFGLDRIDTSKVHDWLYKISLTASVLTPICPPVGYLISAAVSILDGILSCFDLGQDLVYGDGWDVLGDLASIALDIVGAISGIQARGLSVTKTLGFSKEWYEPYLSHWDKIGNEATAASGITFLKRLLESTLEKIEEAVDNL